MRQKISVYEPIYNVDGMKASDLADRIRSIRNQCEEDPIIEWEAYDTIILEGWRYATTKEIEQSKEELFDD